MRESTSTLRKGCGQPSGLRAAPSAASSSRAVAAESSTVGPPVRTAETDEAPEAPAEPAHAVAGPEDEGMSVVGESIQPEDSTED
eukprot:10038078-Alexandrium_andersonii.AAC.1